MINGVLFEKAGKRLVTYPVSLNFTEYSIPQGVKEIGSGAFSGCSSLTSVTIPDSVTAIGDYVFARCTSLTAITIPESVIEIGVNPFVGSRELAEINVSSEHPTLEVMDGVLFDRAKKRLVVRKINIYTKQAICDIMNTSTETEVFNYGKSTTNHPFRRRS